MNSQCSDISTVRLSMALAGLVLLMMLISCGKGPPIAATSNRDWVVIAYFDGGIATTPGVGTIQALGPRDRSTTRTLLRESCPNIFYDMSLDDASNLIVCGTDRAPGSPMYYVANLQAWSGRGIEVHNCHPIHHDEVMDSVRITNGYLTICPLISDNVYHTFDRIHELKAPPSSSGIFTAYFIEADSIHFVNSTDHGVIVGVVWPGSSEETLFEVDLTDLTITPYVADTLVTGDQ